MTAETQPKIDIATPKSNHYLDVLDSVFELNEQLRVQKGRFTPIDKQLDKEIFADSRDQVFQIFPEIDHKVKLMRTDNTLVYNDLLVEAFDRSPYSTIHLNLQRLRRELIAETLARVENFQDIPDVLRQKLNPAWQQVTKLPEPKLPQLNPETISNLASLAAIDRMTWERFVDGFSSAQALLKRTLANKYHFSRSQIQGYNRRAIQLSEHMLSSLDTIGSCTPWQLRLNKQAYLDRVNSTSYGYVSEDFGMDRLLIDGKMWSDENLDDPKVVKWIRALETGQLSENH